MKIDAMLSRNVRETEDDAAVLEAAGYDGLWVGETKHDPFLQLLSAARATRAVDDRHRGRHRVRPHADDAGEHRVRPGAHVRRPVRARTRVPGEGRTSSGGSRCRGRTPRRACVSS